MVDYVRLIASAVASLNPNTSELRHALYDRARKTLVDKLRASDPNLSHTDLRAESAALESAIHHVEVDSVRRARPLQPKSGYEIYDAPVEEYQDRPPLKGIRRRRRIIAGAFWTLSILLAGVVAYSFWPRILSSTRDALIPRSINRAAEPPTANTGYVYLRQLVYYRTNYPVGTIIVDKPQTFLYVVRSNVSALRYSIGVGPQCIPLAGLYHVVRKEEWPGWNPSPQQSADTVSDRMKNPLGARALYLNKDYRIHGSNESATIGQRVPEGCIRLVNDDVVYLYDRTPLESRVVILN
jgi:hypothetical protein